MSNKDSKIILIVLFVLLCFISLFYSFLFYKNHQLFLMINDNVNRLTIEKLVHVMFYLFKVVVIILFSFLAISKGIFNKLNNLLMANLIVVFPIILFGVSRYIAVPILFSKSMMIVDIIDLYLFGNTAYFMVKGILYLYRKWTI